MAPEDFKVIIVGGSIAGLTLAHALDKLGVDYAVLEKRVEIAPQEGASVGILPNGARILDQLGLYAAIEESTAPLGATRIFFPDNFQFNSPYPKEMLKKFGYPIAFLERRRLLEILHDALPNKKRIHTNQTVTRIEKVEENGRGRIQAHTRNGDVFEGDLVVGADGVHSRIRSEIWRLSGLSKANEMPQQENDRTSVEYSCIFGVSRDIPEYTGREQVMRMFDGRTLVAIPSKDKLVFWFMLQKLDRQYKYGDAPRYTPEDAAAECAKVMDASLGGGLRFEHIWNKRQVFNMLALEEQSLQTWSFDRVVCIGDSIHKMTINLGQGANCAIEDVAVLANLLHDCLSQRSVSKPTDLDINTLLQRFKTTHESRVLDICNMSRLVTRVQARDGSLQKIIGRYIMPSFGTYIDSRPFRLIANAAVLEFLPLPRSSFSGWEKYKSKGPGIGLWGVVPPMLLLFVALKMTLASGK